MKGTTMRLRRPSESFSALVCGTESPQTPVAAFAARLASELARLKRRPCRFETDGFFPQDLLLAFAPARRAAVLTGGAPAYADWQRVAAVRLAELLAGRRFAVQREEFGREIAGWPSLTVAQAAGPARFVRDVLSGKDGDVRLLTLPTVLFGAELVHFVAQGGTSQVWRVRYHGRDAVLKLPRPGAEARFRAELALRAGLPPHPGIAEELARSTGDRPYCILEFCRKASLDELAPHLAELACGLDFLHRQGILHGDLRRSNFGLRADGSAAIFDFSHAKRPSAQDLRRAAEEEQATLQSLLLQGAENERGIVSGDVPRTGQAVA